MIGNANGKYVTDSAGTIRIDGLTPGMTVIAREVRAKDGYILDDTPQSIKIKRNAVMTLEFRNQPKGGVLVKKVDAMTNAPISDVEFLVTDSDGNFIGNANGKFVTDSAGTFTITDVAPGTTLIIKETRAKDGYILDDTPQTVKVKSNEVVTVEFRNQPKGNLIVVKQDSVTKAPLEGVRFKIVYANGSYVDADILSCETVTRGYMIYVQTPNDQLHHRLYSGYSKRQALSMARHTDFDREAGLLFGQPCKTVKER